MPSARRRLVAAALFTFVGLVVVAEPLAAAPNAARRIEAWTTSADGTQRLSRLPDLAWSHAPEDGPVIRVDPAQRFQRIEGFGASVTDAAAELIEERLDPAARAALVRELFDVRRGIGLSLTRVPIGASDFSRTHYSFDDQPAGRSDPELVSFSARPAEKNVLPLLRRIRSANAGLRVFLSPWSPPGWMKSSGSMIQGTLRDDAHAPFARYLLRSVRAFEASGVPVYALTVQNEPNFVPPDYPGMKMSAPERARFVANHLGPLLAREAPRLRLLEWDHNWDEPESPLAVLGDPAASRHVAGVAWHCYNGDVGAQSRVRDAHPDKEAWLTECSGGGWQPGWKESLADLTGDVVIGPLRHWARGVILWNLALDENSGPHLGGCGNCRGVVTIDSRTGAITRNVEYYVLGHVSRFVARGAVRIASDSDRDGLMTVAFRNPERGAYVLLVLNSASEARRFAVATPTGRFHATIAAGSATTYRWR